MIRIDRNGISVPIPPGVIEQSYAAQDAAIAQGKTLDDSEVAAGAVITAYVEGLPSSWFPSISAGLKLKPGGAYDDAIAKLDPTDVAAKQAHVDRDCETKVAAYNEAVAKRLEEDKRTAAADAAAAAPHEASAPAPAASPRGGKNVLAEPEG